MGTRLLQAVTVVVLGVAAAGAMVLLNHEPAPPEISTRASSTAAGTYPADLITTAREAEAPAPAPVSSSSASPDASPAATLSEPTWRSSGEATGAWIEMAWDAPEEVNRVRIDGAGSAATTYTTAIVSFDDGSTVMVTPDSAGNVLVDIPARTTSTVRVTFSEVPEGVASVAIDALLIDDGGGTVAGPGTSALTASQGSTDPQALVDGTIANGDVGATWRPRAQPAWIQQDWPEPVSLASVQITGATGYGQSTSGRLVFSDGSEVPVTGIVSGAQPVTTIAITPRTVTWMRLELDHGSTVLGEFRAYGPGETPPMWPAAGDYASTPASPTSCDLDAAPVGTPQDSELALVCPAPGTTLGDDATVVVSGPPDAEVTASAVVDGEVATVATAQFDGEGRAALTVDKGALTTGPTALRVDTPGSSVPLYVQVVNPGGTALAEGTYAPEGLTLQYEDAFDEALSATYSGRGARYATVKPEGTWGGEFGAAIFADPVDGRDLLTTMDGFLRIRVEPFTGDDPREWDRTYASGFLSSARLGGSGFSAQYGYFEARMLAPGGRGTWPAFWMLDTPSALDLDGRAGEVDAVELYGHATTGSCHSLHNWGGDPIESSEPSCLDNNGHADWALAWHTYGAHIRPGGVDYFIDGERITGHEGFERDSLPYFFMINLALDGGWPVQLDPTGGITELYVDWVRVYN